MQNFYWSYKSFFNIKRKKMLKIDRQHLFLFIFSSFISNIFGIFLRGNLLIKCPQMFTGPVGPVEVLFYWPKAIFGNLYWPGAIGPLLASSHEWDSPQLKLLPSALNLMLLVANLTNTKWGKKSENDWKPGKWVIIWEYSERPIQWTPTWQGLDGSQKTLRPCDLNKTIKPQHWKG